LPRSSWLAAATPPTVAIEIASRRVTVVGIAFSSGRPTVAGYASEGLPDGSVQPALSGPNILDPAVVTGALRRALEQSGLGSPRRAALVIPDSMARVSLLTFEQVPSRSEELDQLVQWQVRKSTPFALEDAQVSYFPTGAHGGVTTLAAVVARRDVVAEYEAVVAAAGIHAGIVDLASFNVMNAIVGAGAAADGDWLLVHLAAEATTIAILRGSQLMFYRHRTAVDEEPLGALVHQTAMYHEDRLGGSAFERVWLSGGGNGAEGVRTEIAARLGVAVETLDIRNAPAAGHRLDISIELVDALTAPVGVLIREQRVA
jgi:Tfp pilus assembly PilM family ATPase